VKFSCEKCGRSYVADEKVRGRAFKMKCKQCGNLIVVKPGGAEVTTSAEPSPPTTDHATASPPAAAAADPFAPSGADPFALPPGDPFAVPAADPFARASPHVEDFEKTPLAPPSVTPPRAAFDPFASSDEPPASAGNGVPHGVNEVEAMFADLAEEMKEPQAARPEPTPSRAPSRPPPPPAVFPRAERTPTGGRPLTASTPPAPPPPVSSPVT